MAVVGSAVAVVWSSGEVVAGKYVYPAPIDRIGMLWVVCGVVFAVGVVGLC